MSLIFYVGISDRLAITQCDLRNVHCATCRISAGYFRQTLTISIKLLDNGMRQNRILTFFVQILVVTTSLNVIDVKVVNSR